MKNGIYHERPAVETMVPWLSIVNTQSMVVSRDDTMFRVFRYRGRDMDSATKLELVQYTAAINNALKRLGTGYTLYFEAQRMRTRGYMKSAMPTPLLQLMEDERQAYYEGTEHFESFYYIMLHWEPPSAIKRVIFNFFLKEGKAREKGTHADPHEIENILTEFRTESNKFIAELMGGDKLCEVHELANDDLVSFLHDLLSDHRQYVSTDNNQYLYGYLPDAHVQIGSEDLKLGSKYIRVVTIKSFAAESMPGFFDSLNKLNIEYRWSSRWICRSPEDAKKELANSQQFYGQQAKSIPAIIRETLTQRQSDDNIDEAMLVNQDDVRSALYELGQDAVSYGYYTLALIVLDPNKEECKKKAAIVVQVLNSLGFVAFIETINAMEAWRGSLPGCWRCNIRRPMINSLNLCHLSPLTAQWSGDELNYHLSAHYAQLSPEKYDSGMPVLLYTDSDGYTPFRLSLHVGDIGHTMIIGPSGSGKSVLLNTIEAHFTKYPKANVFIFDKAASSRALTYAIGGNFYNLAAETENELSFQPLANIDDNNEMIWAKGWIISYLSSKNMTLTPTEENYVWNALVSLRQFPASKRTMSTFTDMVQNTQIRTALTALTKRGSYGKLFDNDFDFSGTGHWQVYEMETLMNTPEIVPSTLDYLFHRIESKIEKATGPSIIVLDECWLFFDNPLFRDKLREYFKDMRKKNTSIIFATQSLADVASKKDLLATVADCASKIYLPNINAGNDQNRDLYRLFNCNNQQIDIISHMTPKRDYYYTSDRGNRVFRLALQPSELPFITATGKSDQQKMNQLRDQGKMNDFIHEWFLYKDAEREWEKYSTYAEDVPISSETASDDTVAFET